MSNSPETQPNTPLLHKMAVLSPTTRERRATEQRDRIVAQMHRQPMGDILAADQRFSTTLGVFKSFGLLRNGAREITEFEKAYRKKEHQVANADPEERRRLVGLAMEYAEPTHPNAVIVNVFLDAVLALSNPNQKRADEVALMTRTAVALLEENPPR